MSDLPQLPPDQQGLHDILVEHRGPSNAISSTELAETLGIDDGNGNPTTRFGIRDMMRQTGLPIGACPDGYYVIDDPADLEEYVADLRARKRGIDERIDLVTSCYADGPVEPAQSTLDFGGVHGDE